jgi:hypothetical protein
MSMSRALKARIKLAWSTGLYDTIDLAERFKRTEADIYNLIGRMMAPTGVKK